MKIYFKKKNKIKISAFVTGFLLFIFSVSIVYAAEDSLKISLPLIQNIYDDDEKIDNENKEVAHYILKSSETGNPMPLGSEDGVLQFSFAGTGNFNLPEIEFENEGIYLYTVSYEECGELKSLQKKTSFDIKIQIVSETAELKPYVFAYDENGSKTDLSFDFQLTEYSKYSKTKDDVEEPSTSSEDDTPTEEDDTSEEDGSIINPEETTTADKVTKKAATNITTSKKAETTAVKAVKTADESGTRIAFLLVVMCIALAIIFITLRKQGKKE